MKKNTLFLFFLFLFTLFAILILAPFPDQRGSYNVFSKLVACHNPSSCYHEIGHKLDHEAGWISQSEEFQRAVELHIEAMSDPDGDHPFNEMILSFPGITRNHPLHLERNLFNYGFWNNGWGGTIELYTSLFEWSQGKWLNMPERLREFYDWERAAELIEKYVRSK